MVIIHVVTAEDTLSGIGKKYNTTVEILAELNNIDNPDYILTGAELLVPLD